MAISLDTIRTGHDLKAPKAVTYGVGGIGKTTWAAGAPSPIFIFAEDGLGKLDVPRFPLCKSWEEILECVEALYTQEHEYGTVVLDTIDMAEPLLWDYTARKHGKDGIEGWGYGKGYVYAVNEARTLLAGLDALRDEKNMAIVLLAHAHTRKYEAPDLESFDRYQMRLHDKLAAHIQEWTDVMMFANYKTSVVKDDEGFGKRRARAVGQGERVMYTEERPAFAAKNRYGLPPELPLSWQAFQDGIVVPAEPKPVTENGDT